MYLNYMHWQQSKSALISDQLHANDWVDLRNGKSDHKLSVFSSGWKPYSSLVPKYTFQKVDLFFKPQSLQ